MLYAAGGLMNKEKDCITRRYNIWKPGEYYYKMAYGFVPNLVSYQHTDERDRPCMIVVPGGGYRAVAPTEGEIVALEFWRRGYNAFVLTYTTNFLYNAPLHKQALEDISRAVRFIRRNRDEFHIVNDQVILCGFSAGAHLCGSLGVHYADVVDRNVEYQTVSNRPDTIVLCYPVITATGRYGHEESFDALIGFEPSGETVRGAERTAVNAALEYADIAEYKDEAEYFSLEKHVSKTTPPCFIWQTVTDDDVPVENSILFAKALRKNGVKFAMHLFSSGKHGLSLANEQWKNGECSEAYTLEQAFLLADKVKSGEITDIHIPLSEVDGFCTDSKNFVRRMTRDGVCNKEVAIWPKLADEFIYCLVSPR